MKLAPAALLVILASGPTYGQEVWTGNLVLVESARVTSGEVCLQDVAVGELPAELSSLLLTAGGAPGQSIEISRRLILRKLVQAGLAAGVNLGGATSCRVHFAGQPIAWDSWQERVDAALGDLVPPQADGAPDAWLETNVPLPSRGVQGDWRLALLSTEKLSPGRNLVRAAVVSREGREELTIQATLHAYGQVGRARAELDRDAPLRPENFNWEWVDLADSHHGLVLGADSLTGQSLKRTLAAGDLLRRTDLRETPVVRAGDPVELRASRGQVSVTIRAYARQSGVLGQVIPVRNELTGRLVNARIAGPGLVEWRR